MVIKKVRKLPPTPTKPIGRRHRGEGWGKTQEEQANPRRQRNQTIRRRRRSQHSEGGVGKPVGEDKEGEQIRTHFHSCFQDSFIEELLFLGIHESYRLRKHMGKGFKLGNERSRSILISSVTRKGGILNRL